MRKRGREGGEGSGDEVVEWALEPLPPSNTNGVVLNRRGEVYWVEVSGKEKVQLITYGRRLVAGSR